MFSIWSTIEIECICRDLSYFEYLERHTAGVAGFKYSGSAVSEAFYLAIKSGFNNQLENEIGKANQ